MYIYIYIYTMYASDFKWMLAAHIIFSVKQSIRGSVGALAGPAEDGTEAIHWWPEGPAPATVFQAGAVWWLMVDDRWFMIHDWSVALVTLVILNFDWLIYACLPPSAPNPRQVFLRSKALELALDASARSAELRLALRTYALAVPARWVMETGNGSGDGQM